MDIKLDTLQLERLGIAPLELTGSQEEKLITVMNLNHYQLDWLSMLLGFPRALWDDLELSILEKRILLSHALSPDPSWGYPLSQNNRPFGKFRLIPVKGTSIYGDNTPEITIYAGNTYIFDIREALGFTLNCPTELVTDRRINGYLVLTVPLGYNNVPLEWSYSFVDLSDMSVVLGPIKLTLLPSRDVSDWFSYRVPVKKKITPDSWDDSGYTWYGSEVNHDIPRYPKYNREGDPPDGVYYTDSRPTLDLEEDFYTAQYFSYDNEFFESEGIPELIYRPAAFYDFWGIWGSKSSAYSFNLMADSLNLTGFNDEVLVLVTAQSTYDNYTGEYTISREYHPNDIFKYTHLNHSESLTNAQLESWYKAVTTFTSEDITKELREGLIVPLPNPRKSIYRMPLGSTKNDLINLRLWVQRDLQVNAPLADNIMIADSGYTNGTEVGYYYLRLPLEYTRDSLGWRRANVLMEHFSYFGPDSEPNEVKIQDYRVCYAYFASDFSSADDPLFDPKVPACEFEPLDPRRSLYLKNRN